MRLNTQIPLHTNAVYAFKMSGLLNRTFVGLHLFAGDDARDLRKNRQKRLNVVRLSHVKFE